ncbi:MAG: hypothetical protein R3F41_14225 [Gammaproteobacteria bacterium]|nr:hypothetical protein [Pseudomonadales bacterium]
MNLKNLNEWLTLGANIGVLIGIFVVAIELQQTQVEMRAESNTTRKEMARQNDLIARDLRISELTQKIREGGELTFTERTDAATFFRSLYRHFENLHFQHEQGVLDEETWQSINDSILVQCESPMYRYLFPEGLNQVLYRVSFREFVNSACNQ